MIRNGLVFLFVCNFLWGEGFNHSTPRANVNTKPSQKEQFGFVSEGHQTLTPSGKNNKVPLQMEKGSVAQGTRARRRAFWIYQGKKGKPNLQLSLFAADAGYARSFVEAQEACNRLIPFGEWKLASVVHVMAFFNELLPSFVISQETKTIGTMFWATSSSEKDDRDNKDMFFTSKNDGKSDVQKLSYGQFLGQVRATEAKATDSEEKEYYGKLLKFIEPGVPVICISGIEPEVRKERRK